jgi:hypothetical protein
MHKQDILTLLLSIPTGIVAALLASRIQKRLEARATRVTSRKRAEVREEYLRIKSYRDNSTVLQIQLLTSLLALVGFGVYLVASIGIAGGYALLLGTGVLPVPERWKDPLLLLLWMAAVLSMSTLFIAASRALRTLTDALKVQHFDKYVVYVQRALGQDELNKV